MTSVSRPSLRLTISSGLFPGLIDAIILHIICNVESRSGVSEKRDRKFQWFISKFCPAIHLEGLKKITISFSVNDLKKKI